MTNQILVGSLTAPTAVFTPDSIRDISGNFSSAIIGDTLSIDTLVPTVGLAIIFDVPFITADDELFYTADDEQLFTADTEEAPADETLEEGTVLYWMHGANLKGKFYVRDVTRTGVKTYQVTAYSAIGLLETVRHSGGIYTGQTAEDMLLEIIGNNFPFSVSDDVAAQRVYGWLPYDSARNNLHKLLLALGINVTKDEVGDVVFEFVSAGTPTNVPGDRVFLGGSVRRESVASRVEVTEHTYIATDSGEPVTVFDNTDASGYADHKTVIFGDAPVHSLTTSAGLTVEESNPNYAVVSGVGVLTAKKYAHITQIIGADNSLARLENVKSVPGDTLINPINGYNVLQRLYDYFTRSDTIGADLKVTTELPNQLLTLTDAFREQRTAWLKSMDFRATTFIRASAQLVADYTPGHTGNLYTAVQRVTADGTWTVPTGVERIRIVLIGGGSGGSGGYDGTDGHGGDPEYGGDMTWLNNGTTRGWYYQGGKADAGTGGAAGQAGVPGKVFAIELDVTAGAVISVSVGAAGVGGARNGGSGSAGGDTTAKIDTAEYSSAGGMIATAGVLDLISGTVYGRPASDGIPGGDGGITDTYSKVGNNGADGLPGSDTGGWTGGSGGAGISEPVLPEPAESAAASGGGGGGAAYGAAGHPGTSGYISAEPDGSYIISGGDGGDGADAMPPSAPNYGDAGGGGNGGGGGGNGAGDRFYGQWHSAGRIFPGDAGAGGHGSIGGNGGAGIALIYYKAVD